MAETLRWTTFKNRGFAFYRERSLGEQRSLWLIAGLIALLVIYGLLHTAMGFSRQAKANYLREQTLLTWMQQHADQARRAAAAKPQNNNDTSLLALASNTGKTYQLVFQRIEPSADGKLSVWLSDTEFNALLRWLEFLVTHHPVQIDRINLSASEKPGAVEAQVVLRSPSAS